MCHNGRLAIFEQANRHLSARNLHKIFGAPQQLQLHLIAQDFNALTSDPNASDSHSHSMYCMLTFQSK